MALIHCDRASFAYDRQTVVESVSFSLPPGGYLAIVGENGAGKSTLLRGILGLKAPAEGRISLGDGLTRREIGYLPQQTDIQRQFPASVWEVVLAGCLSRRGLRPYYSRREREGARDNLEALGIWDLRDQCYRDLSGGQQQRVLLARAVFAARRLLVLDEPAASLDPVAVADLYSRIRRLNRERGLAVVMVSHDVDAALEQGADILHLSHWMAFFGTAGQYRESDVGRSFLERGGA